MPIENQRVFWEKIWRGDLNIYTEEQIFRLANKIKETRRVRGD